MERSQFHHEGLTLSYLDTGGHVVHQDNPNGFADTVREFLRSR